MALPACHAIPIPRSAEDDGLASYRVSSITLGRYVLGCRSILLNIHIHDMAHGYNLGEFIWTGGDVHIYANHLDQVREQLSRRPILTPS